ncbi:MAG: hypothetical protein L3J52_03100, partial [Proteobacteria bacterium]|nr:hypothetical protein [Pseudomonadota bacterium]
MTKNLYSNYLKTWLYSLLIWAVLYLLVKFTYHSLLPLFELSEKKFSLYALGWHLETSILLMVYLVILLFSSRVFFAFYSSILLYSVFLVVNLVKIHFLNMPLVPVDFTQVDDLLRTWDLFVQFVPAISVFFIVIIVWLYVGLKRFKTSPGIRKVLLLPLLLVFVAQIYYKEEIRVLLYQNNIYYKKNSNLTIRGLKYGFGTGFVQAFFFASTPDKPDQYSKQKVIDLIEEYGLNKESAESAESDVSLVADNIIF